MLRTETTEENVKKYRKKKAAAMKLKEKLNYRLEKLEKKRLKHVSEKEKAKLEQKEGNVVSGVAAQCREKDWESRWSNVVDVVFLQGRCKRGSTSICGRSDIDSDDTGCVFFALLQL